MVKLIALYQKPADAEAFNNHYRTVHMPLANKMPGLRRCELGWVTGSPGGEARYHLVAELYFDSLDALNAAMKSPEGKAAAKDLMSFAGSIVHLMVADAS
ncbi:MAG: EthD family reductase [Phycisphaerales bacterium]|nr:EthD family reductase [Phycisphaerales bacterium]